MKSFQYQILRFLPDRISEEFLNMGIVVYDVENGQLAGEFIEKTGRLSQIFPESSNRNLIKLIKHIDSKLKTIANQLLNEFQFERISQISQITIRALPQDDSSLFFTEPRNILDLDINSVSTYLFDRLIGLNQSNSEKEFRNDKEVWSKVYKKYFDELNISNQLTPVTIKTKFENVEFDHSWRNGHINFFETVNFDLEKTESIRNKVFRWSGQIDELKTASEPLHLYLLSILPEDDMKTREFIKEFLLSKTSEQVKVDIVTIDDMPKVTMELRAELDAHQ